MFSLLFPPTCAACGSLGQSLCIGCMGKLRNITNDWCINCGNILAHENLCCHFCKGKRETVGVFSIWYYENVLRKVIWAIKYGKEKSLIPELISYIPPDTLARLFVFLGSLHNPIFVPIPLHIQKETERGFNQSTILARSLSAITGIPLCSDALSRTKESRPQAQTSQRLERVQNVIGSFRVVRPHEIVGKEVILIDDIVTTGSTMKEVFRCLHKYSKTPSLAICVGREESCI